MRKGPFIPKPLNPLEKGYVAPESTVQKVDGSDVTQPVSGEVTVTGVNETSGLALEATQQTVNTRIGSPTETVPSTDTASSGLNGRLQRIAQKLTSLISLFPTSLGQKTKANSFAVTLASDQEIALPTGASTEATLIEVRDYLDTVETKLQSIITNTTGVNLEVTQIQVRDYLDTVETKLQSLITALGTPFQAGGSISNTEFAKTKTALTANAATTVTCGATTTVLLATNASRKGLVIINTGVRDIFIGIGASAVLNQGIYLVANGGTWVMDDYTFTTQSINGITISSTSNISIQEFQ